jgi:surface protein
VVDLVIPKEVTSIHGDLNFYGCVGLKSITFPDDANVEYIGAWTFAGCENITTLKFNKHLKRIYECAFSGCKLIESLVIPDEVTLIEAAAFSGCTNLKELKLGKALEEIKTGFWGPAFSGTAIQEITVPEKLQYLSGFWNSKLSIVNIGKTSLKEIANGGRDYPLPISRINITDLSTFMNIQKKNLGGYDLYLNGNLVENLTVPSSVEDVIEYAMGSCQCLKSVTIPSHVKSIGQSAFQSCYYIGKVTFEGGSPKIEKDVFGTYDNVYFITKMQTPSEAPYALINESQRRNILCVPAGRKEKYETADGWKEFRYIVEASGPEEAFLDKGNLYRINGDGVTMLKGGAHAYWGYSLPETVTYNGKTYPVTVIDGVVHEGYSPDIVIYNKVKSIAEGAFASCTGVHSVTSYLRNPFAINSNVFSDEVKQTITLRVPYGTKAKYLATDGWMEFKAIEEMEPEPATPYVVYHDGTLTFYYDDQRSSREGMTYDLNEGEEEPGWYENRSSVTKVVFDSSFATARPTTGHEWFDSCTQLTEIEGLEYLNTSEMTFMDEMFFFCRHLNNVDLSHFETNKVTSMRAMFSGCSGLKSIDLSHFDTRNVEILGAMFYGCSSLTEIDLSNFDTGKVTSFSFILRNCTSLKEVIMGQMFVSTEVANIDNAFEGCTSLKTIQFRGVIPSCINSNFFESVGTAEDPATLVVPKLYKDGYQDKFDGNMFYGGYFTLQERNAIEGDVDGDGEVTEEDIAEVEKVILNPSVGYDPDKDVNHDGVVNVADIVEEVNIINSTGKVEQVNSKVEASLTGCSRGDNGGILLTFTLKNVSGQDFGEVRVGHTGYYQNMEGSTDTGDEIHNLSVSIMSQNSGNWSDDVRFSFPANDTKSLMIGIDNVSATAKSLTLQVGVYCETWEVQNDVIKFVNIPIQ